MLYVESRSWFLPIFHGVTAIVEWLLEIKKKYYPSILGNELKALTSL